MADEKQSSSRQQKNGNGKPAPAEAQPAQGQQDYKEQMLRLAAEFDNYKKRTKGDVDSAKSIGKAELMKRLLPIVDEFELALIAVSKSDDKSVARGLEMLYSNLMDTLKKDGLVEVDSDGTFDPYKHEIVMAVESGKKNGTILEVVKKGYAVGDVLLRPASVIVAKEPSALKAEPQK